ncbi:MAG TPA: hypothetical protein VN239_07070 [Nitrososphaera sp.]|nr:hypothetical protein [Nitrososphaera sp.]
MCNQLQQALTGINNKAFVSFLKVLEGHSRLMVCNETGVQVNQLLIIKRQGLRVDYMYFLQRIKRWSSKQ